MYIQPIVVFLKIDYYCSSFHRHLNVAKEMFSIEIFTVHNTTMYHRLKRIRM
jgi:hypothetical protein